MNQLTAPLLLIFSSYLFGAIPFGYLVARWRGLDILHAGSGNIGATNVWRVLGGRFGLLVFVLDFTKGALPVLAGLWVGALEAGSEHAWSREAYAVAAGLAAFLGHLFPVYLRFRGGKGVATGAGVVAVLVPLPALGALLTWVAVLCASRYVSLSSLTAALGLCVIRLGKTTRPLAPDNRILTLFCFVAVVLVFIRHRSNVVRLFQGRENRLPDTATMRLFTKTIHVLALGLWFGTVLFFILAALLIFQAFERLGASDVNRPEWLPLAADFTKEQGTRLAGVAVAPLFQWYFPMQVACGVVALGTSLAWARGQTARRVDGLRALLLTVALTTAAVGWPLARYVGELRIDRYSSDRTVAEPALAAFGAWHAASLLLNMTTAVLVTSAMALAAQLPFPSAPQSERPRES